VDYVLGTDLPAGINAGTSTRVSWYERTSGQVATNEIYLNSDGNWYYTGVGGSGPANDKLLPMLEGFLVEIPTNESPQTIRLIGEVPTNAAAQRVQVLPTNSYSLASTHIPCYTHPSELNLLAAGWRQSSLPFPWPGQMDTIVVWDSASQSWREIWLDSEGTWRYTFPSPSFPTVPSNALGPDEALLFNRIDAEQPLYWTNSLLYPLPNREMDP
jgi:hypothetical protein